MNALTSLMFAFLLFCAPAFAADPAADIMNVSGTVTVLRADAKSPALAGGQLETGDLLATGPNSSAGLSFSDGSRISLGADSELRVDSYVFEPQDKQYGMEMLLRKGVAAISTGKMAKLEPQSMNVSTPLATLGIRGTKILVKAQ